ncbi:MAG: hypothetical protein U5L72_11800 [Bacteroidales bacterium]|nr:hypothetical protein [Bacteroidales bacterium]
MKKLPGIFNDVIGPVMRGPSSSHTAASWRIARIGLDILNEPLKKALAEFDSNGAWAPNYREQGTAMGIEGGLLGLDITDERMKVSGGCARQKGIEIEYQVSSFPTDHANTVRLTLWGVSEKRVQIIAVSLGGGSFEIRSVNGFPVQLNGDLNEILIFNKNKPKISDELRTIVPSGVEFSSEQLGDVIKYELKSSYPFSAELMTRLQNHPAVDEIALINPIMPVISGRETEMPFTTVQSLIDYAGEKDADLGKMGLIYEKCISGIAEEELITKMKEIILIIHKSIETGLGGTQYADRILQQQSHLIAKAEKKAE